MQEPLYVATDSHGVEHAAKGDIAWALPENGNPMITELAGLELHTTTSLLDKLDQFVFLAEPVGASAAADTSNGDTSNGDVSAASARLVERTGWNAEVATRFALDCADHMLQQEGDVRLPDGTALLDVLADARDVVEGVSSDAMERLGYLARLKALHRLRHQHSELADISRKLALQNVARDIDALDDPAYATAALAAHAVLAAIEALRHHVRGDLAEDLADAGEQAEQHHQMDEPSMDLPKVYSTSIGPVSVGGVQVLTYEPAWSAARETARQARIAAHARDGEDGEAAEATWQASTLAEALAG